jgi:hypothetical protein
MDGTTMITHRPGAPARLHDPAELVDALGPVGRDYAAACRLALDMDPADMNHALECRRRLYHRLIDQVCFSTAILVYDADVLEW